MPLNSSGPLSSGLFEMKRHVPCSWPHAWPGALRVDFYGKATSKGAHGKCLPKVPIARTGPPLSWPPPVLVPSLAEGPPLSWPPRSWPPRSWPPVWPRSRTVLAPPHDPGPPRSWPPRSLAPSLAKASHSPGPHGPGPPTVLAPHRSLPRPPDWYGRSIMAMVCREESQVARCPSAASELLSTPTLV